MVRARTLSAASAAVTAALLWGPGAASAGLTFTQSTYSVGTTPVSIAAAVLDSRGGPPVPFVVTANAGSSDLTILKGNGSGGFAAGTSFPLGGGSIPQSVLATDFGTGGQADLAVAYKSAGQVVVKVYSGDGTGAFTPEATLTDPGWTGTVSLAAADIDLDGSTDLAVSSSSSLGVWVYLGDGSFTFTKTAASPIALGRSPMAIAAMAQGGTDLFTANTADDSVTTIVDAASSSPVVSTVPAGTAPAAIATTWDKLPNLEHLHIGVAASGSGTAALFQRPGLTALPGSPFALGGSPSGIVAGVYGGNFVHVLDPTSFPGAYTQSFSDFAITRNADDAVSFLLGDGAGNYRRSPTTLATGDGPVAIADDGAGDLAVANQTAGTVSVFHNTRTPALTVAPATVGYAVQPRFTLAAAQPVRITNTGGRPVRITGVELVGADPGDFLISSDGCGGAQIPAGYDANCSVAVRFAPTAAGPRTAILRVTDDGTGAAHDVTLTGTGGDLPAGAASLVPGPIGPVGPRGPAGTDGRLVLVAYQATVGRRKVTVRYALTGPAGVALKVKPAARRTAVTVARAKGRTGIQTISWNRRINGTTARPGSYRLTVAATAGGRSAASAITIRLR